MHLSQTLPGWCGLIFQLKTVIHGAYNMDFNVPPTVQELREYESLQNTAIIDVCDAFFVTIFIFGKREPRRPLFFAVVHC